MDGPAHQLSLSARPAATRLAGAFALALLAGATFAQEASLEAPATAHAGAEVAIGWRGPDAPGDFLAIAEPQASAAEFLAYARTSAGDPAVMTAPNAGDYEVRYISGAGLAVLARAPLSISAEGAGAGLSAPAEVQADGELEVTVGEPGDPADYVTVVSPEAPATEVGPYARLRGELTVTLAAPGEPGAYEIRLIRASGQTVLARAGLTVLPPPENETEADGSRTAARSADPADPSAEANGDETAPSNADEAGGNRAKDASSRVQTPRSATLMALIAVDRDRSFRVAWEGPGAEGDWIGVVPPRAGADAAVLAQPVKAGAPAALTAPAAPGDYEIVYVSGGAVLARRALEVR